MARDDRHDPTRPPPPSPRDLRASLSSSIGISQGRSGRGGRVEPHFAPEFDAAAPVEAATHPFIAPSDVPLATVEVPAAVVVEASGAPAPSPRRSATRRKGAEKAGRRKERPRTGTPETGGRDIVPPQAVAGRALVLVVAIMGFLACLAVGGLALVSEAARDWQLDVSREVTIQVKPVDGVAMEPRLKRATEIAQSTPGVRSARLVGESEGEKLLEPWLGSGLDLASLPIPRLVVIDLADPAAADLTALKARISAEVHGASVDDHSIWAARLRTMAGTAVVAGVAVVVLMLTAMVLSVVFATRAAMAGNRDVIEVLHFVGAEDRFIAGEFQRHFLKLGLIGGAIGGVAAILVFVVADFATRTRGDALSDQAHALFGGFSVGWSGHLGTVAVVAAVAVLTAVTSRRTVLGHLGRLD
ncbi:MAG: ABC transporter permease [Siculibacillus sp.]|nr:ABC transporter permease [Siculibacillus sp.]